MATFWDSSKVLSEFGNAFDISNAEVASKTAAQAEPPKGKMFDLGKRAGQFASGNSFLSRLLRATPGLALAGEAVVDATDGNTAGAVVRGAGAIGAVAGGLPGRAFAGGLAGGSLAAEGVATLASIMSPQPSVLAPAFAEEVRKAGGAAQFTSDTQAKIQAAQEVAAQQATAAKAAEAEKVIANSQQQATQAAVDDRFDRRMDVEKAIARLPRPDASLYRGGFAALPQLFAQTADFVAKRGQLQRVAKQEFESSEKALDRASNEGINRSKLLADFKKAMKPDIKIASVESGLSKQPVIVQDGMPVATVTVDDKGRVTAQPVASRPTTAQAHAEATAKIEASSNKAFTKQQVNDRLKAMGYPPLP